MLDASVWVAALDAADPEQRVAAECLARLARADVPVVVPAHLRVEIACALARRWGDPQRACDVATALLDGPFIHELMIDRSLAAEAATEGTARRLRGADALYVAVAQREAATLVALDRELIDRAGAMTPSVWLASIAPVPEA